MNEPAPRQVQRATRRDAESTARVASWRVATSRVIGLVSVALYNWWVVVAFNGRLLRNPNAFFSDLEATGRPDAQVLQHLDLAAGLLLLVALALRGPIGAVGERREWKYLCGFAIAGAVGGQFSYACSEGLSRACRSAEWHLRLPAHHYVHVVSGMFEFAFATIAIYLLWRRTRDERNATATFATSLVATLAVGYPLLGVAYLTDRGGAFIEPIFFVCFSAIALFELFERANT